MNKLYKYSFFVVTLIPLISFSQEDKSLDFQKEISPLKQKVQSLQSENNKLKSELNLLKSEIGNTNQKLKSVEQLVVSNANDIQKTNSELSGKITNTETTTNQKFNEVDNSLSKIPYGQLLVFWVQ